MNTIFLNYAEAAGLNLATARGHGFRVRGGAAPRNDSSCYKYFAGRIIARHICATGLLS